jgi:hypothetical protein
MAGQTLTNSAGAVIGRIEIKANGDQAIYSKDGKYLGLFEGKSGVTFDHSGRRLGSGNLLATLLH